MLLNTQEGYRALLNFPHGSPFEFTKIRSLYKAALLANHIFRTASMTVLMLVRPFGCSLSLSVSVWVDRFFTVSYDVDQH